MADIDEALIFDEDFVGAMVGDMSISHTKEQREAIMKVHLDALKNGGADGKKPIPPRADILSFRDVNGETAFLIRLREECDAIVTYHIKRYSEFQALHTALQNAEKDRPWGQTAVLTVLPELPTNGRFGFRRQLSKLGVGDFIEKQKEALQTFLNTLMVQLPTISADADVKAFFRKTATSSGQGLNALPADGLDQETGLLWSMVAEVRGETSLSTVQGYWRLRGSDRIWTIEESGRALLDGKHRGTEFDLQQRGDRFETVVVREDGWQIDIEKSTANTLVWTMPGQADLEWIREGKEAAEAALQDIAYRRAALAAKKGIVVHGEQAAAPAPAAAAAPAPAAATAAEGEVGAKEAPAAPPAADVAAAAAA